jgi:hypothetical protein
MDDGKLIGEKTASSRTGTLYPTGLDPADNCNSGSTTLADEDDTSASSAFGLAPVNLSANGGSLGVVVHNNPSGTLLQQPLTGNPQTPHVNTGPFFVSQQEKDSDFRDPATGVVDAVKFAGALPLTGEVRIVSEIGASVRSGVDIETSQIVEKLLCGTVLRYHDVQVLIPAADHLDCVPVVRLKVALANGRLGWISTHGRTSEWNIVLAEVAINSRKISEPTSVVDLSQLGEADKENKPTDLGNASLRRKSGALRTSETMFTSLQSKAQRNTPDKNERAEFERPSREQTDLVYCPFCSVDMTSWSIPAREQVCEERHLLHAMTDSAFTAR